MSLISYLTPRILARYSTKYNRDIRILEEQGKYKLLVNGSRQSGEYIKNLWKRALAAFSILPSPEVTRILVLGVAGGTVIHLLHALYPDALLTGVDIDERMIDVGKKYFSLDQVRRLTLVAANAQEFVRTSVKEKAHWDMIVVDLYIGANIPPFVGEETFLRQLKKILSPRGIVLVNYLREFEYGKLSELLAGKLKRIFSECQSVEINFNRFFYCR